MLHAFRKSPMKIRRSPSILAAASLAAVLISIAAEAGAVASAELYQNQTYTYGRFEARVRFAAGDGVISSFFLWKPGSEVAGTFWNELDFEKLGADCRLQTNPLYGAPVVDHSAIASVEGDLCGEYHTYAFEWTPSYIAYLVDGVEVRRDGAETAAAFAENAAAGMQIHFNIWPGDATFGGNFDAALLPVQQYISWVQYSSFADGAFTFEWREELDGATLPSGWAVGNWASPKNLSTHQPANVAFTSGVGVLSLTADGATGFAGTPPADPAAGSDPGSAPGEGAGGAASAGGAAAAPAPSETSGGASSGGASTGAGVAGSSNSPDAAGGASASGVAGTSASAAGAGSSSTPPAASPSDSSDGGCSLAGRSSPSPRRALELALVGAALVVRQWRRRPEKARSRPPGAPR